MTEESRKPIGVIYVIQNEAKTDEVKIGYAKDLKKRLDKFHEGPQVSDKFQAYAAYDVYKRNQDTDLHKLIITIKPELRKFLEFNDGRKKRTEFFKMTVDQALTVLECIAKISGTLDRFHLTSPEGYILENKVANKKGKGGSNYTEEYLVAKGNDEVKELYYRLKKSLTDLDGVSFKPTQNYVAFKAKKNFVYVVIYKHFLMLIINKKKGTLEDPKSMSIEVPKSNHWGYGNYRLNLSTESDFNYAIGLIKQAYDEKN